MDACHLCGLNPLQEGGRQPPSIVISISRHVALYNAVIQPIGAVELITLSTSTSIKALIATRTFWSSHGKARGTIIFRIHFSRAGCVLE
jgi:hypothetical protein